MNAITLTASLFAVLAPLVGVVTAVVLEHEADHRQQQGERADQEHPPADRDAKRGKGGSKTDEQRPPAMRAEESKLPGPLLDLSLPVVFGPRRQPPASEQDIEASQERKGDGERERGGARRVLRQVPVEDVGDAEEYGAAKEQPALDPHAGTPAFSTAK